MLSASSSNVNRKPSRPLILFPGSLGDLVCALPAFAVLSKMHGKKIVVAARGEAFELCAACSAIEQVVSLEGKIFSQLFLEFTQIETWTHNFFRSFSQIVSWYGHPNGKVTENLLLLSQGRFESFAFFTGQEDCHATSYYLRCVNEAHLQCPSLRLPKNVLQWQELFWRRHWERSTRLLAFHPGSGGRKKRWEAEGFRKIAEWWRKEGGERQVLVLLGPAESQEEKDWLAVGTVVTSPSLMQAAALLSRAQLYLGNDSGVSHLAGAVGASGVVLFGPTSPQKWRPLGGNLFVMRNQAYRTAFPHHEGISLDEIAVEDVIARLSLLAAESFLCAE